MCHLIRSGIKYTMKYQAIRQLFVYCYPLKYELIHLNNNLFWCANIKLSHSSWKLPRSGNLNFDLLWGDRDQRWSRHSYWEMFEHDKPTQSSLTVLCHQKPLYHSNKKKSDIIRYKYRCRPKMFHTCFQQAEASHCIMAIGKGEWQAAKWILMVQRSFTVHLCQDLFLVQLELVTSCLVMTLLSVAPCRPVDPVIVDPVIAFRERLWSVMLILCDLASAEKHFVSKIKPNKMPSH